MSGLFPGLGSGPARPKHEAWTHDRQVAPGISRFTTRDTGKTDQGRPVRVPVAPYFRAYCVCGWIGGRQGGLHCAQATLRVHVSDSQ